MIEERSILNIFTSIGHDSIIGKGAILSSYCTLNGNVVVGNNLFMGTRSSVLLKSQIGNNCSISAHSVADGIIDDNIMVKDTIIQKRVKNRLI